MNLITAKQKAEELGIDRSTLSRWVRDKKLDPAMTLDNGAMLFESAPKTAVPNGTLPVTPALSGSTPT
jgi:predicted site-specific integrase-resolvase